METLAHDDGVSAVGPHEIVTIESRPIAGEALGGVDFVTANGEGARETVDDLEFLAVGVAEIGVAAR